MLVVGMLFSNAHSESVDKVYEKLINFSFPESLQQSENFTRKYLCRYKSPNKCCSCDKNCRFYRTCCIDAFVDENTKSFDQYLNYFFHNIDIATDIAKFPIIDGQNFYKTEDVHTVTRCRNKNSSYYRECNRMIPTNEFPIRVEGSDGVIYYNKFCALCHNVTNFRNLKFELTNCAINQKESTLVRNKKCSLRINRTTTLYDSIVDIVKQITKSQAYRCRSYVERKMCFNPYFAIASVDKKQYFSNPYCAKCVSKNTNLTSDLCEKVYHKFEQQKRIIPLPDPQVVITFTEFGKPIFEYKSKFTFCGEGYDYDLFQDKCSKNYYINTIPKKQTHHIKRVYQEMMDFSFPNTNPKLFEIMLMRYFCVYQSKSKCCSCSNDCRLYGTCCIDALYDSKFETFRDYLEYFLQQSEVKHYTELLPVISDSQEVSSIIGENNSCYIERVMTVAKCNNESTFYKLCNESRGNDTAHHFRVKGRDGLIYRNKFCALCHNVTNYQKVQHKINFCREYKIADLHKNLLTGNNNTAMEQKNCKVSIEISKTFDSNLKFLGNVFYPNEAELHCLPAEKFMCLNSFLGLVETAEDFENLPNPFCRKCLNITEKRPVYDCFMFRQSSAPDVAFSKISITTLSLKIGKNSVGMLVDVPSLTKESPNIIPKCKKGYMYDKQKRTCVGVVETNKPVMIKIEAIPKKPATEMSDSSKKSMHGATAMGKTPASQGLGPHFSGLIKVGSRQLLTLKLQEKILVCLTKLNGSIWFVNHNANLGLKGKSETPKKKHYRNLLLFETMLTKYNNLKYLIKTIAYANRTGNISVAYISLQNDNLLTKLHDIEPYKYFLGNRVCASFNLIEKFDVTRTCDILHNHVIFNITNRTIYWLEISNSYTVSAKAARCTKFLPLPNCPLIRVDKSLINIINKKVYMKNGNNYKPLKTENYFPLPDGVAVCEFSSDNKARNWYRTLNKAVNVISIILLLPSALMEILLITTYLKIKELRTIPGKNLISICFSLFACDITLLYLLFAKNIPDKLCKFTAAILHFFSLSLSVWTGVMAFDLWSTFRTSFKQRASRSSLKNYSLVGWGTPTVVLLVCLALEQLGNNPIAYGKDGQCFITNIYAKVFTFLIPTFGISFASCIMLLITVKKLKIAFKSQPKEMAINSASPDLMKMVIKLSLVLGLVELVGIVQVPTNHNDETITVINSVFNFIYAVARSSRGCFIFLTFMLTKQMQKYYKRIHFRNQSWRLSFSMPDISTLHEANLTENDGKSIKM